MIEIDEGLGAPEALAHFFAGDEIAGALEEHEQDLEGLGVKFHADAVLAELAGGGIGLERAEGEDARSRVSEH